MESLDGKMHGWLTRCVPILQLMVLAVLERGLIATFLQILQLACRGARLGEPHDAVAVAVVVGGVTPAPRPGRRRANRCASSSRCSTPSPFLSASAAPRRPVASRSTPLQHSLRSPSRRTRASQRRGRRGRAAELVRHRRCIRHSR